MRKLFVLALALACLFAHAQHDNKGIPFVHGKHWNELLAMAKKENKFIFVDCFTTWCGPCKMMSAQVFTQPSVGDFFKKNFISLKAQMDKTKKDPEDIKSLYADFEKIEADHDIQVYPTFLFFSPDGKLVHKFVGGMSADVFIEKSREALNPATQYVTLKSAFPSKSTDTAYLRKMIRGASESYEDASSYFDAYAKTQADMFTKENIPYVELLADDPGQPGYKLIAANPEKYDAATTPGKAEELIVTLTSNVMYRSVYPQGAAEANQDKIHEIEKNSPAFAKRILHNMRVMHASRTGQWAVYGDEIVSYMQSYGNKVNSHMQLNEMAWNVFENCSKKDVLTAALDWSRRSLSGDDENNASYQDTYANLLYKLGNKEEAISVETKAMNNDRENSETYKETLEKMKKGEKTWKD